MTDNQTNQASERREARVHSIDEEVEAFLAEVAPQDRDSTTHTPQNQSTESDDTRRSAHRGQIAEPASLERPVSGVNRGAEPPDLGVGSAQNSAHGHFNGHSVEVDGQNLPITERAGFPPVGTESATVDGPTHGPEAPPSEDRMTVSESTGGSDAPTRRIISWCRRELAAVKHDLTAGDAWNQGVPPLKDTMRYSREAGWTGEGQALRRLHLTYDYMVSLGGQYAGITFAKVVRRPSTLIGAVLLTLLLGWTALTYIPANPVFDLIAAMLHGLADLFSK